MNQIMIKPQERQKDKMKTMRMDFFFDYFIGGHERFRRSHRFDKKRE